MPGDMRQRFCESCKRSVHDLSALTRKQAEHLLKASPEGLCGRISCDETGKMIFQPEAQPARRHFVRVSLLGISAYASHASASTDVNSCSVEVRIVDPTNSSVTGAHVTLSRDDSSGASREGVTDSMGFLNRRLDAGRYRLRIEVPGFSTYARDVDLDCRNESPARIDVQLQLGGLMDNIVEVRPLPANPFVRAWYRTRGLFERFGNRFRTE